MIYKVKTFLFALLLIIPFSFAFALSVPVVIPVLINNENLLVVLYPPTRAESESYSSNDIHCPKAKKSEEVRWWITAINFSYSFCSFLILSLFL